VPEGLLLRAVSQTFRVIKQFCAEIRVFIPFAKKSDRPTVAVQAGNIMTQVI